MSLVSCHLCFFSLIAHLCMAFASLASLSLHSHTYKTGEDDLPNGIHQTITVDQSGYGDHTNIQAAINSVPSNNKNWICINVKAGTYREQVTIPIDKPFIYLKGSGMRKTTVVWDTKGADISHATFISEADNIVVKAMTFINSYNYPPESTKNPRRQAVAGQLAGDKTAIHNCAFMGWQDTVWDRTGRHYFKDSYIVGAVDTIFGYARSIYENCKIVVNARSLGNGVRGYITANGRSSPQDMSGFVFKGCHILGDGKTYLGRPWKAFATVIFYQTKMENVIVPAGWTNVFAVIYSNDTSTMTDVKTLTFAEYGSTGKGANRHKRVPWLTKLSPDQLKSYTNITYIDSDGWLERQPYPLSRVN